MAKDKPKRITDIGPPNFENFLPPIIKENYGKWKYHEIPRPGVLVHTSDSGAKLYSVRAGSPRLVSTKKIRMFSALADKYSDGFLRFTSRHNVEFLLTKEENIDPLIKDLLALGSQIITSSAPLARGVITMRDSLYLTSISVKVSSAMLPI